MILNVIQITFLGFTTAACRLTFTRLRFISITRPVSFSLSTGRLRKTFLDTPVDDSAATVSRRDFSSAALVTPGFQDPNRN